MKVPSRTIQLALGFAASFLAVTGMSCWSPTVHAAHASDLPKPSYNDKGEMIRPDISYREWVYVGTPLTPNDLNNGNASFPEFHNVYIHPNDFDHYRRTGNFPDGTVMIKELVLVGSKAAVSGRGYFMGEFAGLEATVKDSARFPDEPGNWAYFSFGHSYPLADSAAAFPAAACNACHAASAADDFVFTQYYPVLSAAKAAGSGRSMNKDDESFEKMATGMASAMGVIFQPTAPTAKVNSAVPTDQAKLFKYLKSGDYKKFAAQESGEHPAAGPHTNIGWPVRVFLDPVLDSSLAAGNAEHPVGSAAVKEMYADDGKLQGWAVMVKTEKDGAGGAGWFWYEVTSIKNGDDPVAIGNGVPLCFGCHFPGKDFVLTGYPLR
jgi:hypothetical protein